MTISDEDLDALIKSLPDFSPITVRFKFHHGDFVATEVSDLGPVVITEAPAKRSVPVGISNMTFAFVDDACAWASEHRDHGFDPDRVQLAIDRIPEHSIYTMLKPPVGGRAAALVLGLDRPMAIVGTPFWCSPGVVVDGLFQQLPGTVLSFSAVRRFPRRRLWPLRSSR